MINTTPYPNNLIFEKITLSLEKSYLLNLGSKLSMEVDKKINHLSRRIYIMGPELI